ncbi:MAG: enoyl-CoA hydratase/isomerase family protein [Chitinophagaceae bacterium]|jgi:methylglutaconyl-CoA hydratase|nr:enoyl-CoA hydratase/isomerase family protein [Chitinophagaceae bacterium]
MQAIAEGYVQTDLHQHIATIRFFHPQSNSLPGRLLAELAQAISAAGANDDCRVIVLRADGEKAFCAGASFTELSAIETEEQGLRFFSGFAQVINAMRKCGKLIIGRIHGRCVGGGVGLAAACDYALATSQADVKLSELAVGIGPFVIGPAVQRKIGLSAFSQLALEASQFQPAAWAHSKGLFAAVHPGIEALDEAVYAMATSLAGRNPQALAGLKQIFWEGTDDWDALLHGRAAMSGQMILSEFSKEAIGRFKAGARNI